MTQDYEFILLRMGYKPLKVTQGIGRFYPGQHVWGKLIRVLGRDQSYYWEIVNESGKLLGTLPRYSAKRREKYVTL